MTTFIHLEKGKRKGGREGREEERNSRFVPTSEKIRKLSFLPPPHSWAKICSKSSTGFPLSVGKIPNSNIMLWVVFVAYILNNIHSPLPNNTSTCLSKHLTPNFKADLNCLILQCMTISGNYQWSLISKEVCCFSYCWQPLCDHEEKHAENDRAMS